MANNNDYQIKIEKTAEDLFNYAIDRDFTKVLLSNLPQNLKVKPNTIEYELQLLKIISVGWSISFYIEESDQKKQIGTYFWEAIHKFSSDLSESTGLLIGQDIDYFQTIKDRLNTYVQALDENPHAPEPAVVIGPKFAKLCGDENEVNAVLVGSKLFISTIGGVKEYLEEIKLR